MGEVHHVRTVRDVAIRAGGDRIILRTYRPVEDPSPLPALVYFHGGGWVTGSIDTHDRLCRSLAIYAGCTVVSVDYGLAPESPFPAALKDCVAATNYVTNNPDEFGIHRGRIAVGGDSAGGNIAAVICQVARDSGGPPIAHQLLIYPVLQADTSATESYRRFAEGYYLTKADMEWFLHHYLGGHDRHDPRVAPARTQDLRGLPSATVMTAEFDVLRDEGEAYAERLKAAGVDVSLRRFDGMFHPFLLFAGVLDTARHAQAWAAERLRRALAPENSNLER